MFCSTCISMCGFKKTISCEVSLMWKGEIEVNAKYV